MERDFIIQKRGEEVEKRKEGVQLVREEIRIQVEEDLKNQLKRY